MSSVSPQVAQPPKKARRSPKTQKHPNNIKKAVQESPWKLYQVAEKANIPLDTLSDYCAGEYPVPYERLEALARVLKCQPEYLVPPLPNVRQAYASHSQHEETKDLEALLVLRTHCDLHPTDENALQQLMELLGKVGRFQEIERWYSRFLAEQKKEDIWHTPDASTAELLAQLRTQSALASSPPASEKGEQATPTQGEACSDPAREAQAAPQGAFEDGSSQKKDAHASPGLPTPPPDASVPTSPPDLAPQTTAMGSDKTIVIQASQVQIVVQPFPNEVQSGILPSVTVTTPSFLDPTTERQRGANAQRLDATDLRDSSSLSPTDRVGSLKAYGTLSFGELATCQQQVNISRTIEQWRTMNDEHITDPDSLTRRDLIALASVSFPLLTHIRQRHLTASVLEEFLSEVTASLTTCWYLLRDGGHAIVEITLPQYLPELVEVAKSSSFYRQRASYLAAQGFFLLSLLDMHRLRPTENIAHCQKAVRYARESGNLTLLVTCLEQLSNTFYHTGRIDESLSAYLEAERESRSTEIPGILRSRVRSGLSLPYAQQGKSEEVTQFIDGAYAAFTESDDELPVFLGATNGRFVLILDEGRSILDLGNHEQKQGDLGRAQKYWKDAAEKLSQIAHLPSSVLVPTGIAAEIEIARALAYVKARNMEGFLTAFEKGARIAKELGSEKRKQEAREALNAALEQWQGDQRITGLWELLV